MLLSVVIVARNEEKNIARCIESVLENTRVIPGTEILLADSVSTDKTIEIAGRYPINIVQLRPNWQLSPSAGRFTGVNNISGDFVMIIDGDMELLAGWVEKAISFLQSNHNVATVVARHYDVYYLKDGSLSEPCVSRSSSGKTFVQKVPYVFESSIFRRSYLCEVGNFHPFLRAGEEAEISYRLTQKGYELYFLPYDSIRHYSIPRRSFQETRRRVRNNLWRGMGDVFSWYLRQGKFTILWQRFKVYFFCMFIFLLSVMGIVLLISTRHLTGVIFTFIPTWFWLFMVIKKRSFFEGTLSFINIVIISWNLIIALFRKVRNIDEYPRDAVWVKRNNIFMKSSHLLLVGSDFKNKKGSGDKNFWVDLIPLLAPAFLRITVLSLTKTSLTCEEFNVGNCKIIVKFISPVFLETPEVDSRGIFWKEGVYPSYLGIIEKLLTFRKLKREIIDFKRHSPFTHIHLMDNFGFTNRLISKCADTPITVSAMAYQGNFPAFIYDNYLRISYNAPNLKVVAYSEILRKKLISIGVDPENIVTIPWGVSLDEQLNDELIDKEPLKETFSIQIEQPLILWSGYIQQIKRKDFLFAYNLAKEVKKKGYKGTFFFAFKPESFENKFYKIADEAKQLEVIIKATSKEEFDKLTDSADVFFSPILNNRCIVAPPLTWIEMLNKGIPIVTTAVPGTENIILNGETGFLFSNLEELINNLMDIAEKPDGYSTRCKDFVKRRFNVKKSAEAYIELFTKKRS